MIFLGLAAGAQMNTHVATSKAIQYTKPVKMSDPDPNGYVCYTNGTCSGLGLSDLLFHQLQDTLNKTNAEIYLYMKVVHDLVYANPQLTVNGVIDAATVQAANTIGITGLVPGVVGGLSAVDLAANAASLIATMKNWIDAQPTYTGNPGDSTTTKGDTGNTITTNGGGGVIDPTTGRPGTTTTTPPVIYYCADGSKVLDPNQCLTPAQTSQVFVCPDGSQAADPSMCVATYAPTPSPSDSNSVSPPATSDTVVTVSTAPDGTVTVNTAPVAAAVDATPHLFGFPRNWVIGGFVGLGAVIGIGLAVVSVRRHYRTT